MALLSGVFGDGGRWRAWLQRIWRARPMAPVCLALLFLAPPSSAVETMTANEKDLKVAFLYNFALYTEWPLPLGDGLTFCVLGRDEMGAALDVLTTRQIGGKPVIVRHLNSPDALADIGGCHMIYAVATSDAKLGKFAGELRQKPVLRVADTVNTDFAMIALARDGNRLVFDIDNTSVRAAGLILSSKLLRLARSVR